MIGNGQPGPPNQHGHQEGDRKTYLPPPKLNDLLFARKNRLHCLLVGPPGSGKTIAVEYLAQLAGKKLYRIQAHANLFVDEIRGSNGLRDGSSIFNYGAFVEAALDGQDCLIDEANIAPQATLAVINNATDESRVIAIPDKQELIAVHPDFQCFMCINPGCRETRPMNEALVDRFMVIEFDYWDRESEFQLLKFKLPRLSDRDIDDMLKVAGGIREARKQGTHDFDLSIRSMVTWGKHADQVTQSLLTSFRTIILPKVGSLPEYQLQREALLEIARLVLST